MILGNQWYCNVPVFRKEIRLKYQFNASFSICICTGRQNVFRMKPLGIKLHALEFKVFQFLTWKITFYCNCLEDFLTFRNMACNSRKYSCCRLLPSNEITYRINVTANESILSWREWWTRCEDTEVWRSPALWRIHFIHRRFLHNKKWLYSYRTGQDRTQKKTFIYVFTMKKLHIPYVSVKVKLKLRESYWKNNRMVKLRTSQLVLLKVKRQNVWKSVNTFSYIPKLP